VEASRARLLVGAAGLELAEADRHDQRGEQPHPREGRVPEHLPVAGFAEVRPRLAHWHPAPGGAGGPARARNPGKRRRRPGPPGLRYDPAMHRSRLCHFVIDVSDLDQGVSFWSAALNATDEPVPEQVRHIVRRLRLPDSEIRIFVQKTSDEKASKERMHLDLETDDLEAEVSRLEALGATRWDYQAEHGFWVLRDPWGNEFCVLPPYYPELLARREPWNYGPATG
jgi:predicted enzyme related to lactoylglutathione lyase